MLVDKTLVCKECGAEFVFTAGEQEFYRRKGLLHDPARCPACRAERRRARAAEGGFAPSTRTMYPAVCAACGQETEVPFQPRLGRPVYCSSCYASFRRG